MDIFDRYTAADIRQASMVFTVFFSCRTVPSIARAVLSVGSLKKELARKNSPIARNTPNKKEELSLVLPPVLDRTGQFHYKTR